MSNYAQISGGYSHSVVLCNDGTLKSMGLNNEGQLGLGHNSNVTQSETINNLDSIVQVSSGLNHNLALKANGKVYSWGKNNKGQLGHGNNTTSLLPKLITSLSSIKFIETGNQCSFAVDSIGNLYGWGNNEHQQVANTNNSETSPVLIASNIKQVSSSKLFTMAITMQNELLIWGTNSFNIMNNTSIEKTSTPAVIQINETPKKIVTGSYFAAVLTKQGNIYTWGFNKQGSLGNGSFDNTSLPTKINNLSNIKDLSAGEGHIVALTQNGSVYTWGYNYNGELGDNSGSMQNTPVQIAGDSINSIYAGSHHSFFISKEGNAYAWGLNSNNQLLLGNSYSAYSPQKIEFGCPLIKTCETIALIESIDSIFCEGDTINLTSNNTNSNELEWYIQNEYQGNQTNITYLTNAHFGETTIKLKVNNGTCEDSIQKSIYIQKKPTPYISYIPKLCPNDNPYPLSAQPTGGTWSGNGAIFGHFNPAITGSGVHNIQYTISENGCSTTTNKEVTVKNSAPLNISTEVEICEGDSLIVQNQSNNPVYWNNGISSSNTVFHLTSSQYITATATGEELCPLIDSVYIEVNEPPTANFTTTISGNQVQFENTSNNYTNLQWNFGDGNVSDQETPTHEYITNQDYIVELISANQCGSDTITDTLYFITTNTKTSETVTIAEVYPNPSKGIINLKTATNSTSNINLNIYSQTGQLVLTKNIVTGYNNAQINIQHLPVGIYTLVLNNNNTMSSVKITLNK